MGKGVIDYNAVHDRKRKMHNMFGKSNNNNNRNNKNNNNNAPID